MKVEKVNDALFKLEFGNPSNPIEIAQPFPNDEKTEFKIAVYENGRISFQSDEKELVSIEKYTVENGRACLNCHSEQAHFFGFGEKMGELDKRGKSMTMLSKDNPLHLPDTDPLYISIPFFILLSPHKPAMGFYIESTSKSFFDMIGDDFTFGVEDDGIKVYAIYGPNVSDVIKHFSALVGKMPLPPAWALGYQQSRWSYFTSDEVLSVAKRMRKDEIPCDVIYLDIDYMDGYRVFTWSKRFPNPKKTIEELKKMGFKVVTIVDPGVKKEEGYEVYETGKEKDVFLKRKDGSTFEGYVWPGRCNFPDFLRKDVREWWSLQHEKLFDSGIYGIWNDMNEPSIVWDDEKSTEMKRLLNEKGDFDFSLLEKLKSLANQKDYIHEIVHRDDEGKKWEHLKVRNVYALLEAQATKKAFDTFRKGKRSFILSRAGFAGIQKYAAVWTGDNTSWWEHLKSEMAICMGLSLSGVSFCGADVGGFGGNTTSELLIRWTEMGAFFPLFRNHSAIGTRHQEPWAFDKKTEEILKKHIKMRYELFPHLYTLFYESSVSGLPIIRPLFMYDKDDESLYSINDEFMVGDSIIVAPIVHPNTYWRAVYFPKGEWIDLRNGDLYEGKKVYKVNAPLDEIPVFVRKNSIIFRTDPFNFIFEKEEMNLYVDVYGEEAKMTLYEDDGESLEYKNGKYNLCEISVGQRGNILRVNAKYLNHGYEGRYKKMTFRFLSKGKVSNVYVNDEKIPIHFKDGIAQVIMDFEKIR